METRSNLARHLLTKELVKIKYKSFGGAFGEDWRPNLHGI